jgi:hypothetical protein
MRCLSNVGAPEGCSAPVHGAAPHPCKIFSGNSADSGESICAAPSSTLALPQCGPFSAWFNYSYIVASAHLPVVGGLFLGNDTQLLNSSARIWVSQDQRHTAHGQLRYQPWSRFWTSVGASYGTGLPVELNGLPPPILVEEFGQAVVDRVNLNADRVRPSLSVDFSAALDLYKKEARTVRLQGDIRNLNDRLNLINFASAFSGTAVGSPRIFSLHLRFDY